MQRQQEQISSFFANEVQLTELVPLWSPKRNWINLEVHRFYRVLNFFTLFLHLFCKDKRYKIVPIKARKSCQNFPSIKKLAIFFSNGFREYVQYGSYCFVAKFQVPVMLWTFNHCVKYLANLFWSLLNTHRILEKALNIRSLFSRSFSINKLFTDFQYTIWLTFLHV